MPCLWLLYRLIDWVFRLVRKYLRHIKKILNMCKQSHLNNVFYWKNTKNAYKIIFCKCLSSFLILFFINPGPKPNTVADHWAMVWQENIHVIVMLTNIMDGMKVFLFCVPFENISLLWMHERHVWMLVVWLYLSSRFV